MPELEPASCTQAKGGDRWFGAQFRLVVTVPSNLVITGAIEVK